MIDARLCTRVLLAVSCCASAARAGEEMVAGLVGEYFKFDAEVSDFPSLKGRTPHLVRVDKNINIESTDTEFNETDLKDRFVARWSGLLRVSKDCRIRFYTESDDGSRLFVGGRLVVDNGGLHGMEEREGELDLKAGDHEFLVEYFENGLGAGCKVSWEIQGLPREIIPGKAFFHPKSKSPPPPPPAANKDEPK